MVDRCIYKIPVNVFKFWWDSELEEFKCNSVESFRLWSAVAKPKQGPVCNNTVKAKILYKKKIKQNRLNEQKLISEKLCYL